MLIYPGSLVKSKKRKRKMAVSEASPKKWESSFEKQ